MPRLTLCRRFNQFAVFTNPGFTDPVLSMPLARIRAVLATRLKTVAELYLR
jgi:hypothetical protein